MQQNLSGLARASAFSALLVFSLGIGTAYGAEVQKLDLHSAVQLALQNNLALESTRIDVSQKKRKVDTAWNVFIPTVEASGTMTRMNEAMTAGGIVPVPASAIAPGVFDYVTAYSASVPQWGISSSFSATLMLNVAVMEGMRNLKLDYQGGLIGYEMAKAKLERDVRKSYYSILLLTDNITLMEETIAAADRRTTLAQDNFKAGLVPELTVLQARVAAANLRPALAEMRNGLEYSLALFAMTLGLPRGSKLELSEVETPDFVSLNGDELVSGAASQNLEVLSRRQTLITLESGRKLAFYNTYTPSLILGWNMDPSFQGDPFKDSWFMEDGWKQRSGMFRATLSFRFNGLLPFSKEALSLTDMDDSVKKLNIALAQTVRGMETEIDSIILKLEKSRSSIDTLNLNVDLASRAYNLSEDAYKAGFRDLLDVQNAELELRKAKQEVAKERFNYVTGLLDLEYAVGVPFGTISGSK
ncbi:TolC family protein [Treponema sp.]